MEGKVKWFNRAKGYGFIEGNDGQDYFAHRSALEGIFLKENDVVEFEPAEGDRGKQAQNVKLLQKGSEVAGEAPAEEQPTEEEAPVEEQPAEEEPKAEEEAPAEEPSEEEKKEE